MFTSKHKSRNKGHIVLNPVESQDEFETSSHWFYKEIGARVDLILVRFNAHTKSSIKIFYDQLSTEIKTLDCAIPWENCAELYIGIINEVVRK